MSGIETDKNIEGHEYAPADADTVDQETIVSIVHQTLRELGRSEPVTNTWLLNLTIVQEPAQQIHGDGAVRITDMTWAVRRVMEECLTEMEVSNADEAKLLRLRFFEGYTAANLASKIGRSQSNIFYQQRKAIQQLADCLMTREHRAYQTKSSRTGSVAPQTPHSPIREDNPLQQSTQQSTRQLSLPLITHGSLFGLDEKEEALRKIVASPEQPWLVNITGMGGIGKTTLAHSIALWAAENGPFDQIIWITAKTEEFNPWRGSRESYPNPNPLPSTADNSSPQSPSGSTSIDEPTAQYSMTLDMLLERIASQLGMTELLYDSELHVKQASVRIFLAKHPSLVVIDNLETLADVTNLVQHCRALVRPSKVLLTSRYSIHASDVHHVRMDELSQKDSIELFKAEISNRGLQTITESDIDHIQNIYTVIGGNPLALKLIAGQTAILPLNDVLRQLAETDVPSRAERELYSYLYRHTWLLLSPQARTVLLAMAVLPAEGASLDDLVTVVDTNRDQIGDALIQLVDLSLVTVGGWLEKVYSIHRLTHAFLMTEILKNQSDSKLLTREEHLLLSENVCQQAKRLGKMVIDHFARFKDNPKRLEEYRYHLWQAIEVNDSYEQNKEIVIECALAGDAYMVRRGPWERWAELLNRAIGHAIQLNNIEIQAKLHYCIGKLRHKQDLYHEAESSLRHAESLYVTLGDPIWPPRLWLWLAKVNLDRGEWHKASELAHQALTAQEKNSDRAGLADTCSFLGAIAGSRDEQAGCKYWCQRALAIPELVENPTTLALTHSRLALAYMSAGQFDYENSQHHFCLGKAIAEENQDSSALAIILSNWGILEEQQGEFSQSLKKYINAIEVAERCGFVFGVGLACVNIGDIYTHLNQFDLAQQYFKKGIHIFRQLDNKFWLGFSLVGLSGAQRLTGEYTLAAESLDAAQGLDAELHEITERLSHLIIQQEGELALCMNQLDKAKSCSGKFYAYAVNANEALEQPALDSIMTLVRVSLLEEKQPEAEKWLERLRTAANQTNRPDLLAIAEEIQGDVALLKHQPEAGVDAYRTALSYLQEESNDRIVQLKKKLQLKLDELRPS